MRFGGYVKKAVPGKDRRTPVKVAFLTRNRRFFTDMDASNPAGNTPTDADRATAKKAGIGWHPRGGWCRKFPGDKNRTYFGRVGAVDAIRAADREAERRRTGALAEAAAESRLLNLSVGEAVNVYLNHLDREHADGKIGDEQRASYGDELARFAESVGITMKLADLCKMTAPDRVFGPLRKAAIARGVFAAEKHIVQVRTFLDWCSRVRRFCPPPFYADAFDAPTEKEKRATKKSERRKKGVANWTPAEVREIVAAAKATDVHRYAQVLLMLNGGMGATDLSHLEDADVDWERECIHTDRSKTLVPRVVPLWPETRDAMKASRAARGKPADPAHAARFFLTPKGLPLVTGGLSADRKKMRGTDSVRNFFYHLLNPPKGKPSKKGRPRLPDLSHLKRHRAGGYTLRSVFATLARGHGGDSNLDAVILGQKLPRAILEGYLRGNLDSKLRVVTEHVRLQIWPENRQGS